MEDNNKKEWCNIKEEGYGMGKDIWSDGEYTGLVFRGSGIEEVTIGHDKDESIYDTIEVSGGNIWAVVYKLGSQHTKIVRMGVGVKNRFMTVREVKSVINKMSNIYGLDTKQIGVRGVDMIIPYKFIKDETGTYIECRLWCGDTRFRVIGERDNWGFDSSVGSIEGDSILDTFMNGVVWYDMGNIYGYF